MPVIFRQLTPAHNTEPGYAVAKELARQEVEAFGDVRKATVGIAEGSCCAALAVVPNPSYPAQRSLFSFAKQPDGTVRPVYNNVILPYGIVYGNSQMAQGLVQGPVGGHAERAALTKAGGIPIYLEPGNNAVLFVELYRCDRCQKWLNGQGGGLENPYIPLFNAVHALTTLNVWWRWTLDEPGIAAMKAFHNWDLQEQLDNINDLW